MNPGSPPAKSPFRRYTRKPLSAICAICTALVLGFHAVQFQPLQKAQFFAEDTLLRFFGGTAAANPDLVFLAIDHASMRLDQFDPAEIDASPALQLMAHEWPWSRSVYALILDRLIDAGAKVVVLDLVFPTPRDGDDAFRAALDRHRDRVVIGSKFDEGNSAEGETRTHALPASSLIAPTSPLDDRVGFFSTWPDRDAVIRRVRYGVTVSEAFGSTPVPGEEIIASVAAKALEKSGHAALLPPGTEQRRIRFAGPANTFLPRPVCDIFDPKKWPSPEYGSGAFFRGKIVVLGLADSSLHDVHLTPVGYIAGAELHLNAINAALHRDFLRENSGIVNFLLIAAAGALAWAICHRFRGPLLRLGLLACACAAWLLAAEILYSSAGLFILTVAPLIALTSGGILGLGWDFFLERHERARIRSVLDKYVAKNVVELVLAEGDAFAGALQGQRRSVAVLFSDIRGFTTITEEANPEELIAQLNEYFFAMVEAVLAEGGTLQQFVGDAILAVWGDTRTLQAEAGACHAVRTALIMCTALENLNRQWAGQPGRREFKIGIGINQGDVVVGSLGHPLRMRFAVIGDCINTSARLETATKHYVCSILVGETVEALTRDRFHYRRVDWVRFKGKTKPNAVFTPLGEISSPPPPWLGEYHRAIDLHRARQFRAAGEIFRKLSADLGGSDALCAMYSARCDHYVASPPAADWDGSHAMTEK